VTTIANEISLEPPLQLTRSEAYPYAQAAGLN